MGDGMSLRFIVGDRATGKTYKMLKWVEEKHPNEVHVLVCHNSQRAMDLYRQCLAEARPVESWQFIGWQELDERILLGVRHFHRRVDIVFGFDDFDLILMQMLRMHMPRWGVTGPVILNGTTEPIEDWDPTGEAIAAIRAAMPVTELPDEPLELR